MDMELNRPYVTKLITISTVILLFIGVILLFTNRLLDKDNVKNILTSQNNLSYIKNNNDINSMLNDKKIPIEVLDNIKEEDVDKIVANGINRLYLRENSLIGSYDIQLIVRKSIIKYEKEHSLDIYTNIDSDLKRVSKNIASEINTSDDIKSFTFINDLSCFSPIFIILGIAAMIFIIIIEKANGLLVDGAIFSGLSIIIYYLVTTTIYEILGRIKYIDIKNKVLIDSVGTTISAICGVMLVIGLIMLAIFAFKFSRKLFRDFRLKYIYKYE
jgi:hypothetical protein